MARFTSVEVRVGPHDPAPMGDQGLIEVNAVCGERQSAIPDQENLAYNFTCSPALFGDFVSVQKVGEGKFDLNEVYVFTKVEVGRKSVMMELSKT